MNVSPINCHTKVDSNNSIQQKPCVNFKGLKLPVKLADSPFLYGQKNILNRFKDIIPTSIATAAGGIIQTHEDKKRQKRRNGNAYQNLGIYCRNYRDEAYDACANADGNITDACNILLNKVDFFYKENPHKLTNGEISMGYFGNLTNLQEEYLRPLLKTIENAKDKNGNHTSDNLKFLELLIEKDDFNFDGMTGILRKSKDEEGNIDTNAAKKFYDIFIDARQHQDVGDFGDLMQQYYSLSKEGKKDFINLYEKHGVGAAWAFHKIVQESKGKDFEKIIIAINSYMDEYNYEWNHWKPNPILGSLKKATYYQKTKGDNANEGISYENFKHCFIKTISEKHTVDEMDEYFFEEFKRKNQLKNYAQFINNLTFLLQKNNIYLRSIYEKLNNIDNIMKIAEYCRLSGNTNEIIKAIDSDLDTLSIETILQCLEKSCEIRKYTNGSSSKVANFEKYKELTAILQNDKNLRSIYKKLNNLDNIMEIAELCRYSDNINEILQAIDSDLDTHPIETILQCLEKSCDIRENKNGSYKVPNFEKYKKIQEFLQNDKNFTIH